MAVIICHRANAGQEIDALIKVANQAATLSNALKTEFTALVTKLNADAGVTDTNYSSTAVSAASACDTIQAGY